MAVQFADYASIITNASNAGANMMNARMNAANSLGASIRNVGESVRGIVQRQREKKAEQIMEDAIKAKGEYQNDAAFWDKALDDDEWSKALVMNRGTWMDDEGKVHRITDKQLAELQRDGGKRMRAARDESRLPLSQQLERISSRVLPYSKSQSDALLKSAQIEAQREHQFSPISMMQRAQSALITAQQIDSHAQAALKENSSDPAVVQAAIEARNDLERARAFHAKVSSAFYGNDGTPESRSRAEGVVNATVGQQKLYSELAQQVEGFQTLGDLLAAAKEKGLSPALQERIGQLWRQRKADDRADKNVELSDERTKQGGRRLDQADRKFAFDKENVAKGEKGTAKGGAFSQENITKAENIVAALRSGGDLKSFASDLKTLGFDLEKQKISGNLLVARTSKDFTPNTNAEVIAYLEKTYLPKARKAQSGTKNGEKKEKTAAGAGAAFLTGGK